MHAPFACGSCPVHLSSNDCLIRSYHEIASNQIEVHLDGPYQALSMWLPVNMLAVVVDASVASTETVIIMLAY